MPRNTGTNIYTIPPDTEGIPDQTIESAPYNIYIHDVETDLNNPRPIIAGGTGANDADEALVNLGAEKATQLVTNYDTHVWMPGSFRSAGSATAGPIDGHAFAGIVYLNENYLNPPTNANVLVSARDMNDTFVPGRVYVREKKANVWGPWNVDLSMTQIIAEYAPINSPLFTGDARAPTPPVNDIDTTIATTAFVSQAVANGLSAGGGSVDALAYSGIQINGSMEVNQEGVAVAVGNGAHACDCWKLGRAGTMAVGLGTTSDAAVFPKGLRSVLSIDVTTAQTSLGANDFVITAHLVEAYRMQRLAWGTAGAQPITVGFWSANKIAGIYSIAILGGFGGGTRSYTATYTQAVASVYQYNTITVPGVTTGTWNEQNLTGFGLGFAIAAGASVTAPAANTWYPGTYYAAPGQINGVSATDTAVLRITGVVVLPGVVAIPPARSAFLMRPYDTELLVCMRHFQKHQVVVETSALWQSWALPVPMRVAPVITGGGSGFTNQLSSSPTTVGVSQTTRSTQTLTLDARM